MHLIHTNKFITDILHEFLSIKALLHVLAGVCSHPRGVSVLENIYSVVIQLAVLLYNFVYKPLGTVRPIYIYIGQPRSATIQIVAFYIFFSTNISTEYFKHAAHSPFFSSKCLLFHNATFFGSCIIHILHTGCAKI
jgi:hypothetical protein